MFNRLQFPLRLLPAFIADREILHLVRQQQHQLLAALLKGSAEHERLADGRNFGTAPRRFLRSLEQREENVLRFLMELLPCLLIGFWVGRKHQELSVRLAAPLVRFGVPISVMGLLLKGGLSGEMLVAALLWRTHETSQFFSKEKISLSNTTLLLIAQQCRISCKHQLARL